MKRLLFLMFIFALTSLTHAQQINISKYQYWVDNNAVIQTVTTSEENIDIELSSQEITPGIHFINVRFQNSADDWSVPARFAFFIQPSANSTDEMAGYEYWWDDDYANKVWTPQSNTDIAFTVNASTMQPGLHFMNVRMQNSLNKWSTVSRYIVYLPDNENTTDEMVGYEYWWDDDYANKVWTSQSNTDIAFTADISAMQPGLHFMNVRVQNSLNKWSTVSRYIVYLPDNENTTDEMAGYEYWWDDDYANKVWTPQSNTDIAFTVNASTMQPGLHFMNVRVQNSLNKWSTVSRYIVYTTFPEPENIKMQAYEYWWDNDYASKTTKTSKATNIAIRVSTNTLSDGVHFFNFRAQNTLNQWSTITRYIVYKGNDGSNSMIDGYRYSFGSLRTNVSLAPIAEYEMQNHIIPIPQMIEFASVTDGCHYSFGDTAVTLTREVAAPFSIQFRNESGKWSAPVYANDLVLRDTLIRPYKDLLLNGSIHIDSLRCGDFQAFEINPMETGTYYFKATQGCEVGLYYSNGIFVQSMTADELTDIAEIGLFDETYIGIVHHTSDSLRLFFADTDEIDVPVIPTDIESISSELSTRIRVQGQTVLISSDEEKTIYVYTAAGALVRVVDLIVGQTRIEGLGIGVFIIDGEKVIM